MQYLPIGLDLRGRTCVVVGGGQIGNRKVSTLLKAEAAVTVVSPRLTEEVVEWARAGRLRWKAKEYEPGDLDGAFLAVAATDDEETNNQLVHDARARGILVCDASDASRSQVIFGALHQTAEVTIAVFTDGQDPKLARRTRDRVANLIQEGQER